MNRELYIGGVKVDLPDKNISLQYKSNFGGVSDKIKSSYSLTINLPKTPNNNLAMGFSDVPYTIERKARKYYDAIYVQNGVQLIRGKAVLMSASKDAYKISLIWGIFPVLQQWLDGDTTLRDLPLTDEVGFVHYTTQKPDIEIFAKSVGLDYGLYYYNSGDYGGYVLPVIKIGYIFRMILNDVLEGVIDTSAVDISVLDTLYMNFNEDISGDKYVDYKFVIKDCIPDIEQLDFFKAICHLQGWYIEKAGSSVKLLPLDGMKDKTRSVDWSDKVVSIGSIPDAIDFVYNSMAIRNWMRYEEDDTVSINADGYIEVKDETADLDKDLFTLPFAATDNSYYIRQYSMSVNETDGKIYNYIKTEPRLLRIFEDGPFDEDGTPIPELLFDEELFFSNIIRLSYKYYQDIVRQPVVVTVELNLNEFDYFNLDFTRPVYIARYGCYFAIIELKYDGELTKAKLLKLV